MVRPQEVTWNWHFSSMAVPLQMSQCTHDIDPADWDISLNNFDLQLCSKIFALELEVFLCLLAHHLE